MHRAAFALIGSLAVATPAWADCDHFKWSVAKDREAFAAPQKLQSVSGSATVGTGYAVALTPDLSLPYPPERAPAKGTNGAVVAVPKLAAGVYQITLSDEAWIDVVQNDKIVKSSSFSRQKDCPGVSKSVRFNLQEGEATVEISNAAVKSINFTISLSP